MQDADQGIMPERSTDVAMAGAPSGTALAALGAAALALESCGGSSSPSTTATATSPVTAPAFRTTEVAASRFLAQASMGATADTIARVRALGYDGWLTEQFGTARTQTLWDSMVANGFNVASNVNNQLGFDPSLWRQLITAPDQLRQRVGIALLDFLVVGIAGVSNNYAQFSTAAYVDMLMDNAFGNYRTLLDQLTTSPAMGAYLTFINNRKADPRTGAQPDENYARELMQLFSVGLYELNMDGSLRLANGAPIETYSPDDISGLARVWTCLLYTSDAADDM
jgi:uncharacterized protein (DUF1800 family)